MKKNVLDFFLVFAASILFNLIFWQEKMGLNVLLFTIVLTGMMFFKDADLRSSKPAIFTATGTLLMAILVLVNNSVFSKIIYLMSFLAFAGFCKEKNVKFLWHAFMMALISFWKVFLKLFHQLSLGPEGKTHNLKPAWRNLQISIIPILILAAFYLIYYMGNSNFSRLSDSFWREFSNWFQWDISFSRILFFITGVFISGVILLKFRFPRFQRLTANFINHLIRNRKPVPEYISGMISLKTEYQNAILTIFSLNILLFIVNAVDISQVWFGYEESAIQSFKDYVHEGTYLLILSILMAMVVVLFFFRKNLNFYPYNQTLKIGAYLWIAQNGILGLSLLIRNWRYISYHGLAYKRIGVLIFLLMVFIGLVTMLLKVRDRHSNYYLWHHNSWALYFVMILCCFVNWDVMITRYNLNHQTKSEIDFNFLIYTVSDKNIFVLEDYVKSGKLPGHFSDSITEKLAFKKAHFMQKQRNYSFWSWNFPDHRNLNFLKE